MKRAREDTVQTVNLVYINRMDPTTTATDKQAASSATREPAFNYDSLPRIDLNQVKVGQIVVWRQLVLSPSFTADLSPWQERQLVSISSDGQLTFRSHNLDAYLSTWWYDEEGEQVCTVAEWLQNGSEENPMQVTIPVETSFEDLRLLHSADLG